MEQPTTFTQQFSVEQPNGTNHHIEHPTTVTRSSTSEQSTTVTQTITQGTIIEQTTYIKMTSHLDTSRTVSFTPISTFKQ